MDQFIEERFAIPNNCDNVKDAYDNWINLNDKTVKSLCNLIVQKFREEDPDCNVSKSSTYAVALEFSGEEMSDSDKQYSSSRGGLWYYNMTGFNEDMATYMRTIYSENVSDDIKFPEIENYDYNLREVLVACKEAGY